ncbi:MAG: hypothetical protein A2521_05870 [Deltaproteobacteria bacterium RIFOXYD12_FULL_57_12]|nr:MAG: hypothetical protein A2521_05870 [Deltaproteobacteria bacterium RIFOXYD12_FULL_57_12]
MFLLIFYGIYVFIVVAVAVGVFRWLKKKGIGKALLASGLCVTLLSLFFPIPIHGGFTFLVEIMLVELRSGLDRVEQNEKNERKEAFQEKLAARFRGPLALPAREQVTAQLSSFMTANGTRGWYDAQSGLAWTDMLALERTGAPPDLEQAKAFCREFEPKGYWALPTEAELSLFWKAGGYRFSPLADFGTAGLLENVDLQIEMLSLRTSRNGTYALRCVALGPGAPAAGYSSQDIPLKEWNTYQLQKTTPGLSKQ